MKSPLLVVALAVGLVGSIAPAQPPRPYTDWKPEQARRLLTRSPWVATVTWTWRPQLGFDRQAEDVGQEQTVNLRIRLFSAPPIRQAHAVAAAGGDPSRLAAWQAFATRSFDDEIVISCEPTGHPAGSLVLAVVRTRLAEMGVAEIRDDTFLITDSGRKVSLKEYIPPTPDGTGAKFIFPRHLPDGSPLIEADDRRLSFHTAPLPLVSEALPRGALPPCTARNTIPSLTREYAHTTRTSSNTELPVRVTFDLKKCAVGGQVKY